MSEELNKKNELTKLIEHWNNHTDAFIKNFYKKNGSEGSKTCEEEFYEDSENPYLDKLRRISEWAIQLFYFENYFEFKKNSKNKDKKFLVGNYKKQVFQKSETTKEIFYKFHNYMQHADVDDQHLSADDVFFILDKIEQNIYFEFDFEILEIMNKDEKCHINTEIFELLKKKTNNSTTNEKFRINEDKVEQRIFWCKEKKADTNLIYEEIYNQFKSLSKEPIKSINKKEYTYKFINSFFMKLIWGKNYDNRHQEWELNSINSDTANKDNEKSFIKKTILKLWHDNEMVDKKNIERLLFNLDNIYFNNDLRWKLTEYSEYHNLKKSELLLFFKEWFNILEKEPLIKKLNLSLADLSLLSNYVDLANIFFQEQKKIFKNKIFNYNNFKNEEKFEDKLNIIKKTFRYNENASINNFEEYQEFMFQNFSIYDYVIHNFEFNNFKNLLIIEFLKNYPNTHIPLDELTKYLSKYMNFNKQGETILIIYFNIKFYFDIFSQGSSRYYIQNSISYDIFDKKSILQLIELANIKIWVWNNWVKPLFMILDDFKKDNCTKENLNINLDNYIFNDFKMIWSNWHSSFFMFDNPIESKNTLILGSYGIKKQFSNIASVLTKWENHDDNSSKGIDISCEQLFLKDINEKTFDINDLGKLWFKNYEKQLMLFKNGIWSEIQKGAIISPFPNNKNEKYLIYNDKFSNYIFKNKDNFDEYWKKMILSEYEILKQRFLETYSDKKIKKFIKELKDI